VQPLVSVVIPNHNYGRYLGQAIESVLAQTWPRVEILVIDNGSTDDSEHVAARYGDRVRWLQHENQGVSFSRNRGIRESSGELLAFLDADDLWVSNKLDLQVERLTNPRVGLVSSGLEYINEAGDSLGANVEGRGGRVLIDLALRHPTVLAGSSSVLVRRECFARAGGFDAELSTAADWDMWRRIACHFEFDIVRLPLVRYRVHADAMSRDLDRFERDFLRAFGSMWADPAAAEAWPRKRECAARLYYSFSGSSFRAGRLWRCLRWAVVAATTWPPSLPLLLVAAARRAAGVGNGDRLQALIRNQR
jgi:glycosyltransferase involved in cell wall biosynthesis